MLYLSCVMITVAFLITGIFQMSGPSINSIIRNDIERTITENSWVEGIRRADMAIRAKTLTPPAVGSTSVVKHTYDLGWVNAEGPDNADPFTAGVITRKASMHSDIEISRSVPGEDVVISNQVVKVKE